MTKVYFYLSMTICWICSRNFPKNREKIKIEHGFTLLRCLLTKVTRDFFTTISLSGA